MDKFFDKDSKHSEKENKVEKQKPKTLFDHLSHINEIQDKNYFDTLNDADKRTFDLYMINRFLSMDPDLIEIINEIQPNTTGCQLDKELAYKLYIEILPKKRRYLKYIKPRVEEKYDKEVIDILKEYFNVSRREVSDYIVILEQQGKKYEILDILRKYGYDDKDFKRLKLISSTAPQIKRWENDNDD